MEQVIIFIYTSYTIDWNYHIKLTISIFFLYMVDRVESRMFLEIMFSNSQNYKSKLIINHTVSPFP